MSALRVGMVCPYSLSVYGGVQEQVLSLARVLRNRGVDVRVLAPCDGPPPDTGITALGASLPTAANGSIAPIAPDLPAQIRLIKALWNEDFDVLHLHEPLAPRRWYHHGPDAGGAHGRHVPRRRVAARPIDG